MAPLAPLVHPGLQTLVRVRLLLRAPPGQARLPSARLRPTLEDLVGLVDALQPYLVHPPTCASHQLTATEMYGKRWPRSCDCGLSELIDETRVLLTLRPADAWAARREDQALRNA